MSELIDQYLSPHTRRDFLTSSAAVAVAAGAAPLLFGAESASAETSPTSSKGKPMMDTITVADGTKIF